jgi:hypothetical protein
MPKSTTHSNDLLGLVFRAAAIADLAENDASSPVTSLYVRLHTGAIAAGDPGNTNEATYGAYAALAILRNGTGWTVPSGGSLSNAALAQFVECSSGSNVITTVSINKAATGAGPCLYSGALAASRTISAGIQPQFAANALVVTET